MELDIARVIQGFASERKHAAFGDCRTESHMPEAEENDVTQTHTVNDLKRFASSYALCN